MLEKTATTSGRFQARDSGLGIRVPNPESRIPSPVPSPESRIPDLRQPFRWNP